MMPRIWPSGIDSRAVMSLAVNSRTMTWSDFKTGIYHCFYWDKTIDGNKYWTTIHLSASPSKIDMDDVRKRLIRIAMRADMGFRRGL